MQPKNRILEFVRQTDPMWLEADLEEVDLLEGQEFYSHREEITHIHFPTTCVASVYRSLPDGRAAEVASIGKEGLVGFGALIDGRAVFGETLVQIPGKALRIGADDISLLFFKHSRFQEVALHYLRFLISQIMQSLLCHKLHGVKERYSRWLAEADDRIDGASMPITQDLVARSLSVRRASVGDVAAELQRDCVIAYSRGQLQVLDRPNLEAASCVCYRVLRDEYGRLMESLNARK
jgi:CRP-like cAMP-binding protein